MKIQQYILEEYKNGNQKRLLYDLKPLEIDEGLPLKCEARRNKEPHIGRYWYSIQHLKKVKEFWGFEVISIKYYSFKTLSALKRNINKVFGYSHFKDKNIVVPVRR